MTTVGSYEAKTHLPQLLDRVARGEKILITRHGQAVAMLVPPSGREQAQRAGSGQQDAGAAQGRHPGARSHHPTVD